MTAPLQLRTFGDLVLERVHADGTTETVYRAGKLLAVLLQLTLRREVPQRRAELADLFWGDEAPDKARASLRQAIASLHRLLGGDALVATRETVQLAAGAVLTDRERFTEAVTRGDVEAVMTLYRGPFLATEPRVGSEFERWVGAERLRLRRGFLAVMEGAVSEAMRAGDVTRATALARAVRLAEPEDAEGVRLLFDALGAAGRRSDARRVIEEYADQLGRSDDTLPHALVQRLERAREARELPRGEGGPVIDAAALSGLGSELVGRDAVLAELIAAAEQARLGVPRHLVLVGVAGSGKSRVLDEFEARVRLRGARSIRVRLLSAMRAVPFSGLAEVIRALAVQPGAIGVSAATAATLVEFLPELRSEFSAADLLPVSGEDRVRRRQEALIDLVAAVVERRPLSILIDDAQYLDPQSLVVIRSIPRLRDVRLLLVMAAWTSVLDGTDGVEVLDLPPLDGVAVRGMLERVATWPSAAWVDPFLDRLTVRSRGLPQSVMQIVRVVQAEGLLGTAEGGWTAPDPGRLLDRMRDVQPVPLDLERMSAIGRLLLRILSVWGRPVPDVALRGIARALSFEAADEACTAALEGMEARGLVVARASGWVIAHDSIADAMRESDAARDRADVRTAMVRWWVDQAEVDLPTLEHLILLCALGEDLPTARVAVAALTRNAQWRRTQRLSARRLANRLATAAGRADWEGPLYGSMGWVARRSRIELAWYSATAAVGVVGLVMLAAMFWPRLRVEVEPMGESYLPQRLATLQVQPRVGLYDGFGRRLALSFDVRAEAEGVARTIGDTVIAIRDGRAQFRRLALENIDIEPIGSAFTPRPHRIRFRGPWWVIGASTPVHGMVGVAQEGIRVVEMTVNGRQVDSTWQLDHPVGVPLHVVLTFAYTTAGSTANYVVGAGPTWLPPQGSVIRLAGLPRPVVDAWQTVEFDVAPALRPGHQHLLILFRAEDSVEHLFSATNWAVGVPVWGDGNDVTETVTESEIQTLRREGVVMYDRYLMRQYPGRRAQGVVNGVKIEQVLGPPTPTYESSPLIGTAIEIDFIDPDRR